jgi:hypothetical protein
MGWSGRAPAPPAIEAGKGRPRHVVGILRCVDHQSLCGCRDSGVVRSHLAGGFDFEVGELALHRFGPVGTPGGHQYSTKRPWTTGRTATPAPLRRGTAPIGFPNDEPAAALEPSRAMFRCLGGVKLDERCASDRADRARRILNSRLRQDVLNRRQTKRGVCCEQTAKRRAALPARSYIYRSSVGRADWNNQLPRPECTSGATRVREACAGSTGDVETTTSGKGLCLGPAFALSPRSDGGTAIHGGSVHRLRRTGLVSNMQRQCARQLVQQARVLFKTMRIPVQSAVLHRGAPRTQRSSASVTDCKTLLPASVSCGPCHDDQCRRRCSPAPTR